MPEAIEINTFKLERGIMTQMGDSPVHGMIDQSTADWTVAPVRHRLG